MPKFYGNQNSTELLFLGGFLVGLPWVAERFTGDINVCVGQDNWSHSDAINFLQKKTGTTILKGFNDFQPGVSIDAGVCGIRVKDRVAIVAGTSTHFNNLIHVDLELREELALALAKMWGAAGHSSFDRTAQPADVLLMP